MVVDVDDLGMRGDLLDAASGAFQVSRVEEENQLRVDAMRRFRLDVVESGHERVHLRERRRDEHPHLFARGTQRLSEREAAPERVAVGVFVTEDQDLLIGVDQLLDLVVNVWGLVCSSYELVSSLGVSSGSTSFSSSAMWTLYSIEGSSSKRRSGEYLRF